MRLKSDKLITEVRYYNDLKDCGDFYIKSSLNAKKIHCEANYYEKLPSNICHFYPRYMGRCEDGLYSDGYQIEKIKEFDCSLYYTGIKKGKEHLNNFFELLKDYIELIPKKNVSKKTWIESFEKQTIERNNCRYMEIERSTVYVKLNNFFLDNYGKTIADFKNDLNNTLATITDEITEFILWYGHGDLCLSNIIIQNNKIFFIDPKGFSKRDDNYFIPPYDLAKLSQCILGNYDFYNHDLTVNKDEPYLKDKFLNFIKNYGYNLRIIRLIECAHFFSMLPLHLNSLKKMKLFSAEAINILSSFK